MPARLAITNFSRGEFGPQLYGRVDLPQYNAGAKQLRNFVVQKYGGVRFRDGFRFVAPILEDDITTAVRILPFQYSIEQAYVIVMKNLKMNLAALGGMVLEKDLKITAATINGTTSITLTAAYHGYAVGDWIYFSGITGIDEINGRYLKVTAVTTNTFTVAVNAAGWGSLINSTGTTNSAPPPPPPTPEPPPPPPPPPPEPPDLGGTGTEPITHPGTGGTSGGLGSGYGGSGGLSGGSGYWGDGYYQELQ